MSYSKVTGKIPRLLVHDCVPVAEQPDHNPEDSDYLLGQSAVC